MKKFGFFLLAAATLFVSCQKDPVETTVNSIKLNETELTLTVGGSEYLKATTDPAGATVTWTSSDTKVATVNAGGNVMGVGEGTATITAKAGDKTATCKVTVAADAAYDQFNIADWGLFGSEVEYIEGSDTVFTLRSGEEVNCKLGYCTLIAWDGELQYVSGSGWAGAGLMMYADVPLYWIVGGDYDGYYLGGGGFAVAAQEGAYTAKAGYYDVETYGKRIGYLYGNDDSEDAYTSDDNTLFNEKNGGAIVTYVSADEDNWNMLNYGITYAWVKNAILVDADEDEGTAAAWAAQLEWANWTSEDRIMGFLIESTNEDNSVVLTQPYDFATILKTYDENGLFEQTEEAPLKLGNMKRLHKEMPIIKGKKLDKTTFHMAR